MPQPVYPFANWWTLGCLQVLVKLSWITVTYKCLQKPTPSFFLRKSSDVWLLETISVELYNKGQNSFPGIHRFPFLHQPHLRVPASSHGVSWTWGFSKAGVSAFVVSLIYVLLITNDAEGFLNCLLTICVSWMAFQFKYLSFLKWDFFLLLSFESTLYILDTSPLQALCFANILSLSDFSLCFLPASLQGRMFLIMTK